MGGSSHRRCFVKIDVLRNFAEFTGKHLCQSLCKISKNTFSTEHLLATDSGCRNNFLECRPQACNFIKKETLAQSFFPVNFAKFVRTLFLQKTSGQQLLEWFFCENSLWLKDINYYCKKDIHHIYFKPIFHNIVGSRLIEVFLEKRLFIFNQ